MKTYNIRYEVIKTGKFMVRNEVTMEFVLKILAGVVSGKYEITKLYKYIP